MVKIDPPPKPYDTIRLPEEKGHPLAITSWAGFCFAQAASTTIQRLRGPTAQGLKQQSTCAYASAFPSTEQSSKRRTTDRASSIKHQVSSIQRQGSRCARDSLRRINFQAIEHRASSIKHQASSIKHQA
jgi:hypothetical protein